MRTDLESAVLFVPGRASYVAPAAAGGVELHLTEASEWRGAVAKVSFEPEFHTSALYAGGYPAVQNWPAEHIPPLDRREAHLIARPLEERLAAEGWTAEAIEARVSKQGVSSNSIGDVMESIRQGKLNPNDFHQESSRHGIELVTGKLHGVRFFDILGVALDIDPELITRADMKDIYGTPKTAFRGKELAPVAIAKEAAAIVLTKKVLRGVRPGNFDDLVTAEERFIAYAKKDD